MNDSPRAEAQKTPQEGAEADPAESGPPEGREAQTVCQTARPDEQEGKTAAFERKYAMSLTKIARQYTERYDRERSVG